MYAKTPGEAEMEGLYEQEKCKWLAHRAVVCSKLGKEKEANEAYSEFQKMGRINRRYATWLCLISLTCIVMMKSWICASNVKQR